MKYKLIIITAVLALLFSSCSDLFFENRESGNISLNLNISGDNTFNGRKAAVYISHNNSGEELKEELVIDEAAGYGHIFIPRINHGKWSINIEVFNNSGIKVPGDGQTEIEIQIDHTSRVDVDVFIADELLQYSFTFDIMGSLQSAVTIEHFENLYLLSILGNQTVSNHLQYQWTLAHGNFDFLSTGSVIYPDGQSFSFAQKAPALNCTLTYNSNSFNIRRINYTTSDKQYDKETTITLTDMNGTVTTEKDILDFNLDGYETRIPYIDAGQAPIHGIMNVDSSTSVSLQWTIDSTDNIRSIWTFVSPWGTDYTECDFYFNDSLTPGVKATVIPLNPIPNLNADTWYRVLTITFDATVLQSDIDRISVYTPEGILSAIMETNDLSCVTIMERWFKTMP